MPTTPDENELERFDQWSETYERSLVQWLFFDRIHRGVLKRLPADFIPLHILDIGCGTGRLLRRIHSRWPSAALVGIDQSPGMVSQARRYTPAATIYEASAENLPFEDNSVDLAASTMSFHHWTDQPQGVSETCRVLRRGGVFVLADTSIGHGHPLSRVQIQSLFQASGLEICSQSSVVPFIFITVAKKP
jgi:ubiquinone/menaquinone biosynthesis C-methylase UbiE